MVVLFRHLLLFLLFQLAMPLKFLVNSAVVAAKLMFRTSFYRSLLLVSVTGPVVSY